MTNVKERVRPGHIQALVDETRAGLCDNHDKLSRCGKLGAKVANENSLVFRFKTQEWERQLQVDAEDHARVTRAGWVDDYDPLDD
ncbi:MAG: hypothetical protein R3B53_03380 [Candidatus Paceibacterota bacterium]